jgi:WD40 repeat protein
MARSQKPLENHYFILKEENNKHFKSFFEHTSDVFAIVIWKKGFFITGGGDSTIKVWCTSPASCISTLKGHTDNVNALVVYKSVKLASASADQSIKLWDLESGECEMTLNGHAHYVMALALSKDGFLCSGSSDKSIKIWDLESGECLRTMTGHEASVRSIVIDKDNYLISGSVFFLIHKKTQRSERFKVLVSQILKFHRKSSLFEWSSFRPSRIALKKVNII